MIWAGVDVGGFRRAFHVGLLDQDLRVDLHHADSVDQCVARLREVEPDVIAIDAPSSWAEPGELSRAAERAFARSGSCGIRYTPNAVRAAHHRGNYYEWIEHGIRLWRALEQVGFEPIECFPTASWTAWIGPRGRVSRAMWTRDGLTQLGARGLTGLEQATNQDFRDAVAAALTARQWDQHQQTMQCFDGLVVPHPRTLDTTVPG